MQTPQIVAPARNQFFPHQRFNEITLFKDLRYLFINDVYPFKIYSFFNSSVYINILVFKSIT